MDLTPCYNIVDSGDWDARVRQHFTGRLDESQVFDSVMLWLYGGPFKTDRAAIGQLVHLHEFDARLRRRLGDPTLAAAHETTRLAYRKAAGDLS